jgi:hypothetical protein
MGDENMRLVETNKQVKTDFEKLENSQSYEEKFGQVLSCSTVFHLPRPNRKEFWYTVSEANVRLDETNTPVKKNFEKLENSQSYEEKFSQLYTNFYFISLQLYGKIL